MFSIALRSNRNHNVDETPSGRYIRPAALVFGARVKARRRALGLTQTKIYKRTDTGIGYLSSIEQGRANPTLTRVRDRLHATTTG